MPSSGRDKGKARAIEPVVAEAVPPTTSFVEPKPIPSTSLLNIEYPGVITNDVGPSSSTSSYSSLERALSTLHPSALPPLTSSPHEALNFLARIPNEGLKVVECRLGGFGTPRSSIQDDDIDQVYKSPLLGEAVPTNNIVIRIVKRTWRQKKRKRSSSPSSGLPAASEDMALDPALFEDAPSAGVEQLHGHQEKRSRYTGRIKKEYCVEILGLATHTVRFRSMADFAFQPSVASSSNQLDPVMALHRALATMDLAAFQTFRVPAQLEDYQITTPSGVKSNLHMVPPAFFSRMDVPFNYGFQQTPYSELRTVPTPSHLTRPPGSIPFGHVLQRAAQSGTMQRFVNRVRLSNITPQPFRVGRDSRIPTKPLPDVVRIAHRCEPAVLSRLKTLLADRPVWSRVALKNQLTEAELRELNGNNEKVYYALVGYSMVGGPWRDTVVRFGYDVRSDEGSRIYQRIFLRGGTAREPRAQSSQSKGVADEPMGDEEEEEEPTARSSVVPLTAARESNGHVFDGTSLHRNVGNFQLCDITDPVITPYIWRHNDGETHDAAPAGVDEAKLREPMGTEWLRKTWDAETGWYTRRALELIRALVTARFKSLADTGRPLEEDAVETIIGRLRVRWREEDAGVRGGSSQGDEAEATIGQ
ncbi:Transcription factor IIIC, subunit 5 [Kalmanozyma brasiliensis GHG001]|uniref:Uncharacterized protein n=1 Tax=Kalmanozyma brasiliensis (strain GHG001) TaxID=1365824 RepID=V5EKX7_KALBG|nr:Transcription factor IIIC, subunit 5 [Kalmanozyma brasiliensis GHG001]EST05625.1 Transcription factor IIIC, subunit 5 [Kalmanozyma brasiliensis GHG001]